jgi:tetratricopeptide (TPR) repeat protein
MYRLVFESGQRAGQVFDANGTNVVDIGRDPACKIVLEEPGVSRHHTALHQTEEGVFISDLGSTNGTYVNNAKIAKQQRLKAGDRVEVGSVKFVFQIAPPVKPGQTRRRGRLFTIALILVGVIILVELIALGIAWKVRQAKATAPATPPVADAIPATPEAAAPKEAAPNPIEEAQKQLDVKLQRAEDLAREISSARALSQTGVDALAEELKSLRNDIEGLKNQIGELVARPSATMTAPAPSPATPLAPPAPKADPILERAKQMVTEADRAKMAGQFDQAIKILQSANILAPDFVPAYKALAEVCEMRGLTDEAKATWQKIVSFGPGIGPAYEEANRHLQELARKEASSKLPELKPLPAKPVPAAVPTVPKAELPRQLRIVELTKVPHPEDTSVDERYEVKFAIRAQTGEKFVATEEVQIEVKFYDQLDTREVVETNAETTEKFSMPTVWESFDRKTFTATYRAAKGLRKKETEETGKKRRSYGFIVRVMYRGKLQDERSEPDKLLGLMAGPSASAVPKP